MGDPLFDAPADQQETLDFEAVKQKFTKEDGSIDVDALLKKAVHGDAHIHRLENKLDEQTARLDQSQTYEALMAEIKALKAASREDVLERDSEPTEINPVDINKIIDERLNQKQKELAQRQNVDYVSQELTKVWGSNFQSKVSERVADLGLDQETARTLAINNPKAFLNIVIPQDVKPVEPSYAPPRTKQNALPKQAVKNWDYYENIRKTDKKRYWTPELQAELHEEANRQGPAFRQK